MSVEGFCGAVIDYAACHYKLEICYRGHREHRAWIKLSLLGVLGALCVLCGYKKVHQHYYRDTLFSKIVTFMSITRLSLAHCGLTAHMLYYDLRERWNAEELACERRNTRAAR